MGNRSIPPMNRLLDDPQISGCTSSAGREAVKTAVRETLEAARRASSGVPPFDVLRDTVVLRLAAETRRGLLPAINATGVLLHTNLGRAPLARAALDAMRAAGSGYTNLEFDLDAGTRGSRYERASGILKAVTGAQDSLVVNNCAAAMLLIVDTFAKDREVIASRGELVEIGGGFRIPDVLARGGATLVEAGTTNKTSLDDYRRALSANTALLLRTHASNYRVSGFTASAQARELGALARSAGIPLVEDLGSGALVDLAAYGLPHERTVQEALADGAGLVAFSGDKILGGPQAGIIVGSAPLVARLRNNALLRALRVDKLTLAALVETLRCYTSSERLREIPFFAMLSASQQELRARARHYVHAIAGAEAVESTAYAGGGALPEAAIASIAVVLPGTDAARTAAALRASAVPIVARTERDRVLLDLRTIFPEQDGTVIGALERLA